MLPELPDERPARYAEQSILVVDATQVVRDLIGRLCQTIGFGTVDKAPDGIVALKMTREKQHHVIIADMTMEPMTGLELLRSIRSDSDPVVAKGIFLMMTSDLDAKLGTVGNFVSGRS